MAGQHKHHRVLGDGNPICSTVVGHRNAQVLGQGKVHLVIPGAEQLHQLAFGRRLQHPIGKEAGKHDYEIGVLDQCDLFVVIHIRRRGDHVHPRQSLIRHHLPQLGVKVGEEHDFHICHLMFAPNSSVRRRRRQEFTIGVWGTRNPQVSLS